ncbi:hypothetical protein QO021_30100 (plasmid) [Pseudomonas amygdali pv. lachrymans]|uniref:hypothetical protein n=1 Tax=Pseudomonas amygdali TaxID=47877 RepID=UPI0006B9543E|nr:hypothetical protein [Pseudomonas amygdali]RMM39139.1 hypothetical protein ALQ79_200091 [Pseudomonas amygdali pv. lachrymans]WIO61341.1 hypothetical protein QO021_30100 [Pseudomonas amygdali pv. lachrymans]
MAEPQSVVIRERLYPEMHEALVEVLAKYPRQAGNQVVLAMSEACLSFCPISEADYNVADGAEFQNVKFTLSAEKYPKLYALYRALPRGVKGQAIINLLNRHQLFRQADPGKVNDALNEALLGKASVGSSVHPASTKIGVSAARDGDGEAEQKAVVMASNDRPVIHPAPDAILTTETKEPVRAPALEEMDDPLADLPPMDFT